MGDYPSLEAVSPICCSEHAGLQTVEKHGRVGWKAVEFSGEG